MGKIFGISDNPVSTMESALRGMYTVTPPKQVGIKVQPTVFKTVPVKQAVVNKSNPFVKMRNGFGKLLSHFSKVKVK